MRPARRSIQRPHGAKLLVVDPRGHLYHASRRRLIEYLAPGDLLVANDAATIPASLSGYHEPTGDPLEVRLAGRTTLDTDDVRQFVAVLFGAGDHRMRTEDRPAPPHVGIGDVLRLGPLRATVLRLLGHSRFVALAFEAPVDRIWDALATHGKPIQYAHLVQPLRLQDVWTRIAARPAAFEAPSAGFVLDWTLLRALKNRGVLFATLTHAAGISSTGDHELDQRLPFDEPYSIPEHAVQAIEETQRRHGRIVALGTTVIRALEHSASQPGGLSPGPGLANQRIGPYTDLRVADAIITGTHEPGDSHYDVLRAFADDHLLGGVSSALERGDYRSHEFGDTMFVFKQVAHSVVGVRQGEGHLPEGGIAGAESTT